MPPEGWGPCGISPEYWESLGAAAEAATLRGSVGGREVIAGCCVRWLHTVGGDRREGRTRLEPSAGYGLVATVTYTGGGGGQRTQKNFVYRKSTSNFWPL